METLKEIFTKRGFAFEVGKKIRSTGQNNLIGEIANGAYLQIIGPVGKPHKVTLCIPWPSGNKAVLAENMGHLRALFQALIPDEAAQAWKWLERSVLTVFLTKGALETELKSKKLFLDGLLTPDGAIYLVTIAAKDK